MGENRLKKIVVYINSMSPAGGIERVIANLYNELSKEFEIILLTKDNKKSFYKLSDTISVYSLNNYLELDLKESKLKRIFSIIKNLIKGNIKLRKKLKEIDADYIYVVSPLDALEILFTKLRKQKLLISEHGSKLGYNKIYDFIKKKIYSKAYKLIVPSTMDTELYLKDGYPAVYIPHLNTFKNNNKNKLKNNIVINIGRYTDDKQQDILIDIWNELYINNDIKEWELQIIGKGENREKLQNKIKNYRLENSIKLLPPKKNVNEYYEKASIFIFTSRYEGFGMVLLEAMSFGIPCISFDCPSGPRDILKNNKNGYLIENGNNIEFQNKLLKIMKNKNLLNKLGEGAYKTSRAWNNEKILEKWNKIL